MIRSELLRVFSSGKSKCLVATDLPQLMPDPLLLQDLHLPSRNIHPATQHSGGERYTESGLGSNLLELNGFKEFRIINKKSQRLYVMLNQGQFKLVYNIHHQLSNK